MQSKMSKEASPLRGLLYANSAVLLFGLSGVLGKLSGLPAPITTFGRVVFAGVVLLLVALVQRRTLRPRSRRDAALFLGMGMLLALHWVAFFESINVSNVAVGLLSFSTFPFFTAALEPLLLRQKPSRLQVLAALLILPGIYLLVPTFSIEDRTTLGVAWGVLSGATFALLSVGNRWFGRSYPSAVLSLYQSVVAAVTLLPFVLLTPWLGLLTPQAFLILVVLGVVCTALAHTLFIESMRSITAQSASLLTSLEPVWGILFGVLLLGDIPEMKTLLGGVIILCATALPLLVDWASSQRHVRPL